MQGYCVLLILFFLSCQQNQQGKLRSTFNKQIVSNKNIPKLIDSFLDSTAIGRKSYNKIEVKKYKALDSNYVVIKFYSKVKQNWILKDEFHFEIDDILDCNTKISDFNNDGYNDITYVSALAGRGANEIRTLFIYDKPNDRLTYIRNSDQYPNMKYNTTLKCIDAFLVYGGCSTVFLNLMEIV